MGPSTSAKFNATVIVSPFDINPPPKVLQISATGSQRRRNTNRGKTAIITSSPYQRQLLKSNEEKIMKSKGKSSVKQKAKFKKSCA